MKAKSGDADDEWHQTFLRAIFYCQFIAIHSEIWYDAEKAYGGVAVMKFCLKCYWEMETEEMTCPRCGSRLGVRNDAGGYVFQATKVTKEVPAFERAQLICMIPEGRVATTEAIDAFFCRRYNCDGVRYVPPTPIFAKREKGRLVPILIPQPEEEVETIPQWRVVSKRGFVDGFQRIKLQDEGVEVVESGRSYRVPAYREIGISFDWLLTEVKDAPVWGI